jgi:hypothetical protein
MCACAGVGGAHARGGWRGHPAADAGTMLLACILHAFMHSLLLL